MKAFGFGKDEHPDVARFCDEKGYRPQYVYGWLRGRIPTYENVKRLARNFDVPLSWLMLGDEADRAVAVQARASLEGRKHRRPEQRSPTRSTATRSAPGALRASSEVRADSGAA